MLLSGLLNGKEFVLRHLKLLPLPRSLTFQCPLSHRGETCVLENVAVK